MYLHLNTKNELSRPGLSKVTASQTERHDRTRYHTAFEVGN